MFVNVNVPAEYVPPVRKVSCVDNPVMLEPLPYKVAPLIVVADITPLTVNPVKLLIFVVFTPPVGFVIRLTRSPPKLVNNINYYPFQWT